MATGTQQTNSRRWLLPFLAALIAALAAILGFTTASASAAGVAETRVGPFNVVGEVPVGPPEHISAGQRLGEEPSQVIQAVATGVAANDVVQVSRFAGEADGPGDLVVDEARAAAERNGIDTRLMDLSHEAGSPGQYGFTAFNGAGKLMRGPNGAVPSHPD